ncbi:uncharacterized protein LOC131327644 [Rhododendron vialii]|uniref:uncharacterized protein LOC131327644 n=1 Tax=Rhododendron vialii TaxID=182163 RepID=UPI00265ECF64|nr:uncharacterized protein LOC131327644 [Rhododendron vialii]
MLARWLLLLEEFNLKYMTRKSVKGRVVAEFLEDHPVTEAGAEDFMFPDEDVLLLLDDTWQLYFDGVLNQFGCSIGILLVSPNDSHVPLSYKHRFEVTNDQAEYDACIAGMEATLELGAKRLEFDSVTFTHTPCVSNRFADALATLASMVEIPLGFKMWLLMIEQRMKPACECVITEGDEDDGKPWYEDVKRFIEKGEYPLESTLKDKMTLQKLATQFVVCGGALYQRAHLGPNQLCVTREESQKIMEEIHERICGPHMSGTVMAKKILRQGYYWTTMELDCADRLRIPPAELYMTSPWPFSTWGIDSIGSINPKGKYKHQFILVAVDYSTKWVKVASYTTFKATHVAKFIRNNVIYRYGVPHKIICDNGSLFCGATKKLFVEFGIQNHQSSTYRPQTNGAIKATNKNVKRILRKTTDTYTDWPEMLPLALWGYPTTERTSIGATTYSLV